MTSLGKQHLILPERNGKMSLKHRILKDSQLFYWSLTVHRQLRKILCRCAASSDFFFLIGFQISQKIVSLVLAVSAACYLGRKLLSEGFSCYFFPQSSESKFIIRFCQFNGMKTCVTNRKGQSIREYVRKPWNEVWWEQSLLRINNILTLLLMHALHCFKAQRVSFADNYFLKIIKFKVPIQEKERGVTMKLTDSLKWK